MHHYQKNVNYQWSESVGNSYNPSVMMFYRQTFDSKISVGKPLVGNHLPTDCWNSPIIIDGNIHRPVRRLLPTDKGVGNYQQTYSSVNPFLSPCHYRWIHSSVITEGTIRRELLTNVSVGKDMDSTNGLILSHKLFPKWFTKNHYLKPRLVYKIDPFVYACTKLTYGSLI